jgi:AbrB family looped-hinge helix DNA binding protein
MSKLETFLRSKVFQRGKTQIPSEVRKRLSLKDGDTVVWFVYQDGSVRVRKMIPQLFKLTDSGRTEELKKGEVS